ncbi:unnamed protein product [Dracunculus medinensis]|uniref:MFS domain-containing protein n=1 Tax=Dracunculus medinensis TaxID=318479 RepID=A0A158Q458_DRAME|nr:unnamed protein product [Dracunculus medinensis]
MKSVHLHINRFHILIFVLWQLALAFVAQEVFPTFFNYYPQRLSDYKRTMNFSKKICKDDGQEQCELLSDCKNITVLKTPFYGIVEHFHLYCGDDAYSATLVATWQFLGVFCGTVIYGHVGDLLGRKPTTIIGLLIGLISGIISGFATSWKWFAVFRFVAGTSMACIVVVFSTYVMELILPEQRVFLRSFFNWGYARAILTLICFLLPRWQYTSIANACLVLPVILAIFFVPESPKWYAAKANPSLSFHPHIYTMRDLFSNKNTAFHTIPLCAIWFFGGVCTFGIDLNSKNLGGEFFLNQFIMSFSIAIIKAGIFFVDTYVPKFGRRLLFQIPQSVMLICFATISLIMIINDSLQCETSLINWTIIILNFIGISFVEVTWDALYICVAEYFPTEIRAIGTSTCSMMARVGTLLAPQIVYMASFYKPALYIAVVIVGGSSLLLSVIYLPETKGVELSSVNYLELEQSKKRSNATASLV